MMRLAWLSTRLGVTALCCVACTVLGSSTAVAQARPAMAVVIQDDTPVTKAGVAAKLFDRGETVGVLAIEGDRLVFERDPYCWVPVASTVPLSQGEAFFSRELAKEPADLGARLALGLVRFELEQFEACVSDCTAVLEREPENVRALLARSRALGSLRREEAALKDADRVLALQPDCDLARRSRAIALLLLRRTKEAMAEFDRRVQDAPTASAYSDRSDRRYELGDTAGALEDAEAAIRLDANEDAYRILRARVLLRMNRRNDAIEELTPVLDRDSANGSARLLRGLAYIGDKRYDEGLADLDEVIRSGSHPLPAALSWRAMAHLSRGSLAEALADVNEAIALDGGNADLYALRVKVYRRSNKLDSALADADKIVSLQPIAPEAYLLRADVLEQMGQTERAEADRRTAAKLRSATETANEK